MLFILDLDDGPPSTSRSRRLMMAFPDCLHLQNTLAPLMPQMPLAVFDDDLVLLSPEEQRLGDSRLELLVIFDDGLALAVFTCRTKLDSVIPSIHLPFLCDVDMDYQKCVISTWIIRSSLTLCMHIQ